MGFKSGVSLVPCEIMSRTKLGAVAAVVAGVLALTGWYATEGEAQRRGARRAGEPYVRATAGNVTINIPIADAGAEAGNGQVLIGSSWRCVAQRAAGAQVNVTCRSGDVSVGFERAGCDPLSVDLEANEVTYELGLGCE